MLQKYSNLFWHEGVKIFKTELEFAKSNNPRPNLVIRIEKRYNAREIDKLGKNIFSFLKKEVLKLDKLIQFVKK